MKPRWMILLGIIMIISFISFLIAKNDIVIAVSLTSFIWSVSIFILGNVDDD